MTAERAVAPLAACSYRLQRDENTVADVAHSMLVLYPGFVSCAGAIETPKFECLEQRWSVCQQPLFLLGYFLHPLYKSQAKTLLHATPLTWSLLSDFGVYYYRRYMLRYCGSLRRDMVRSSVLTEFRNSVYGFWGYVKGIMQYEKLAELALAVLSTGVDTAMCERHFSELTLIHTRTRNRMKATKGRNIHVVRMRVRRNGDSDNGVSSATHLQRIVCPQERSLLSTPQKRASSRGSVAAGINRQQSSMQTLRFDSSEAVNEKAD
ncbi:hypothetical protein PybrP1_004858 [[Pythium] brassicae (nom. inval.)]|nr:hypothetical protein PybrP1_004858 [[Pythium] brassicae (nom. inval.)]